MSVVFAEDMRESDPRDLPPCASASTVDVLLNISDGSRLLALSMRCRTLRDVTRCIDAIRIDSCDAVVFLSLLFFGELAAIVLVVVMFLANDTCRGMLLDSEGSLGSREPLADDWRARAIALPSDCCERSLEEDRCRRESLAWCVESARLRLVRLNWNADERAKRDVSRLSTHSSDADNSASSKP